MEAAEISEQRRLDPEQQPVTWFAVQVAPAGRSEELFKAATLGRPKERRGSAIDRDRLSAIALACPGRQIAAVCAGNALEFYDFVAYAQTST